MKLLFIMILTFCQLAIANEAPTSEKEYFCIHSSYNIKFKIKFINDRRPTLIYFWKLSQGNVTGRPDFLLSEADLEPGSETNSEFTEYKMLDADNSHKNFYIDLNENKLKRTNAFEASDSRFTTIRAKCQLSSKVTL